MDELQLNSACELRRLLQNREVSCVEVVTAHIEQIEKYNPLVNLIVTECFDRALEVALEQDNSKESQQPLTGLPIAHKDLANTAGIRTTFGSTLFKDHIPQKNDYFIDRMQSAGCVTIGKTNTPEFGAGSHTFNRVFGTSRNPYDLSRTCGGSSGGAAGALAMRMLPLADGGDYGGSLRNPGAFCNVIGFRPTNNTLPPNPEGSNELNLSSLGPMARCVDDVHLLFSVLTQSADQSNQPKTVDPLNLKGLKVAYTQNLGGLPVEDTIQNTVARVARKLEGAGAIVEENLPNLEGAKQIFHTLRGWSFRNRYHELSKKEKVELKPTILWNLTYGESLTDADLDSAIQQRTTLRQRIHEFFEEYDLLLAPTTQVLPFPIEIDWVHEISGQTMQTYIDWMESCSLITATECPALSMPAGFVDHLPVGVQLVAKKDADYNLLRAAKAIEELVSSATQLPPLLCGD